MGARRSRDAAREACGGADLVARQWRCGGVVGLVEAAWVLKRLTRWRLLGIGQQWKPDADVMMPTVKGWDEQRRVRLRGEGQWRWRSRQGMGDFVVIL
ncbi:hypothetical protein M0R45_036315 [Rubus argutus]|uniref:Uncharacterized protein n=1 Tax=Rubus argutus TaxID=59490 RepID=A0AAW1VYI2_RUBAR